MNDFVELRRLMAIVLRRWWLLVVVTAITATIGYVTSRNQNPVYQATTTVIVGQSIKSPQLERADLQTSDALVQTYVEIAHRQPVLEGVITALSLSTTWQKLNKQVTVAQVEGTQLIEISVEASSPRMARKIADEIANQLILISPTTNLQDKENYPFSNFTREQLVYMQQRIMNGQRRLGEIETALENPISEAQLAELQNEKATLLALLTEWENNYTGLLALNRQEKDSNQLTVIESAYADNKPVRPNIKLNTVLSGGLGVILAFCLIFLLDALDDTYKSLNDLSRFEELNILGSIGRIKGKKYSDKIIARLEPFSPITESYRIIRSRIQFKSVDIPRKSVILVTSSIPQEGKSVTVANLGIVMAQADHRTVIVDADLRHPVLHQVFSVDKESGLGDLLSSPEIKIEDCLKKTWVNNLQIITSGKPLPDPSERLGSLRMLEILIELRKIADIVIFDTPPALVFADAVILSNQVDGVIVVIRAGKSKRSAIRQTLIDLQYAKANLLGSIFNHSPQVNTFAMKGSYVHERTQRAFRPQLPFSGALRKKAGLDRTQVLFDDLRELAVSPNEEPEISGLDSEQASRVDMAQLHDLRESVMPANENLELPSLDKVSVDPAQTHDLSDSVMHTDENLELPSLDKVSVDPAQTHDLSDSAVPADENLELPSLDKVSVDPAQSHDLRDSVMATDEILELAGLDSEVKEPKFNIRQDSKAARRTNHRKRHKTG